MAGQEKNSLPNAKVSTTSQVLSSAEIEEVKSVKRTFKEIHSKVRESSFDKTLNDAFGDNDEADTKSDSHSH